MQAEIITIGDEILIGQIVDTNSKWIAEELNKIGISVYQITSIQDDETHILKALKEAENNADIVIVTGGLGPTKDDITKHTMASYFNSELEINEEIVQQIKELFKKIEHPFSELNRLQALLPVKCIPLKNNYGTAPGMWFDENQTIFVSLPGVPTEMKGLMTEEVLPRLKEKYDLPYIIHQTIITHGMGESALAEKIEDWEDELPSFIKLAYLPSAGRVRLRLSAKGNDKVVLQNALKTEVGKLNRQIGNIIIGFDDGASIEEAIASLLYQQSKTMGTAESCTGGEIAARLTAIPGASNYFKGGLIPYNIELKKRFLHILESTIDNYSVVSVEVAKEMALGLQKELNVDYAIATTGNAGPTTDITDKKVGIVCIAIATPNKVFAKEFFFGQPREKVIERASNKAFEMLRKEIIKNS